MQRSDTNPILRDDELMLLDFRAHRPSRGNTAVICLAEGSATRGSTVPPIRERLQRPYRRYEIDLAQHSARYDYELPARGEAFRFRAVIYVTWAVHDPVRIARLGVRDARAVFWPFLGRRLRSLSRQFWVEESALAEEELNNDMKAAPFLLDSGIVISACSVHLGLDDRAREPIAARTEHRWSREREETAHELRLLRDQHAAAVAELRHQIEQREEAHHLELKRLRMEFYREALDQGDLGHVILRLVAHPEDIAGVVAMLEKRDDDLYRRALDLVKDLNGAELFNQADLDPIRQKVLRRLSDLLGDKPSGLKRPSPKRSGPERSGQERSGQGRSGPGDEHKGQNGPEEKGDHRETGSGGRPS